MYIFMQILEFTFPIMIFILWDDFHSLIQNKIETKSVAFDIINFVIKIKNVQIGHSHLLPFYFSEVVG